MDLNLDTVISTMNEKGYKVFDVGTYNLNLVGIRTLPGKSDTFDDWLCVFYKLGGSWQFHKWQLTTDPGLYYLNNPMRTDGTAILIPGQYRSCWRIGSHQGKYTALTQGTYNGFKVWRDRDKNGSPNYSGKVYTDGAGINCHKAGLDSNSVGKWSAGCQVLKKTADFNELIKLAYKQIAHGMGSTFSYSLLTSEDFKECSLD